MFKIYHSLYLYSNFILSIHCALLYIIFLEITPPLAADDCGTLNKTKERGLCIGKYRSVPKKGQNRSPAPLQGYTKGSKTFRGWQKFLKAVTS